MHPARKIAVVWSVAMLATVPDAMAQLRRYDPASGQNVPAGANVPAVQGVPEQPPVSRETQTAPVAKNHQVPAKVPPVVTPAPTPQAAAQTTGQEQQMGQLMVFTTTRKINTTVLKAIHTLREAVPGMELKLYVEEQMPKDYFRMFARLRKILKPEDAFSSDSDGTLAAKYRVTEPNSIVYVAPNGTVRIFDLLSEMEGALHMLERVKKGA